MPDISRHAVVEPTAKLASDVCVGPFAYVGGDVRLGPGCIIDSGATVTGRTSLGARCHVFPLAAVGGGENGQDEGECLVGQANDIREHVAILGGTDQPTCLGDDNLIMIGCRIGPGASVGSHCILSNYTQIEGAARVEDYVGTSAFTSIAAGASVGTYTYVVGFTGVDKHAPPYAMVQGCPFRVRGVNTEKLRRCGFGDDDIRALKEAFRELFNSSGCEVSQEAMARLAGKPDANIHVKRLIDAIAQNRAGSKSP